MKLSTSLSALAGLARTAVANPVVDDPTSHPSPPDPAHLFSNPDPLPSSSSSSSSSSWPAAAARRIPTSYESAVLGRRVLALSPLAHLATVFPTSDADADGLLEHRPAGLGGVPIGLMDYIADCDGADAGDPTILAIRIATSFKNVDAGSNMSVSVHWVPPYPPEKRIESSPPSLLSSSSSYSFHPISWLQTWWRGEEEEEEEEGSRGPPHHSYDPVPYSAANLPRFSLLGYLEPIAPSSEAEADALRSCFLRYHPDARYWLPGNRIHESEWVRLVVTQVYWIGGFGDRAYIGWIPVEEWRNVTREEWQAVRLPGEKKGWREWSVGAEEWEL